jgi:hypothetical protein
VLKVDFSKPGSPFLFSSDVSLRKRSEFDDIYNIKVFLRRRGSFFLAVTFTPVTGKISGNCTPAASSMFLMDGFTSHANLEKAKANAVKDVCFSKGRGPEVEAMCRSRKVYKSLRKFRAGIESGISWLKRSFVLDRCTWKGFQSFKSYIWTSIVSVNLLTIARKQLA